MATDLDGALRSDGLFFETRTVLAAAEPPGIQAVLVTARPPLWPQDTADLVGHHGARPVSQRGILQ